MAKKKKKKNYTVCATIMFMGLIVAMSYIFTCCFMNVYKMYNEKNNLRKKLSSLEKEEEKLNDEVEKLQDKEYIARYAREKYFYSSNGEYIIKLPDEEEGSN